MASNSSPESASNGLSVKSITAIVLLVLGLVFVFSNSSKATLHFLFLDFTMPAWI